MSALLSRRRMADDYSCQPGRLEVPVRADQLVFRSEEPQAPMQTGDRARNQTPTEVLEELRADAASRRESLGSLVDAAGHLRACCDTIELLLQEINSAVGVHLELLDAVLRTRSGNRWWDELAGEGEERAQP